MIKQATKCWRVESSFARLKLTVVQSVANVMCLWEYSMTYDSKYSNTELYIQQLPYIYTMYTYSIIGFVPSDNTVDCNSKSFNDINIPHCCTSFSVQVFCKAPCKLNPQQELHKMF